VKSFFNVSIGIGIWICVIGGIAAIVAGILVLMQRNQAAAPAATGGTVDRGPMGGPADMPPPSGTGVPPTAPPVADAPASPPPAPEMPSTPEPPPAPPAETPDAGGDATTS
jgi:hypothetical protein